MQLQSRREVLTRCGVGMGLIGLTQLLGETGLLTASAKAAASQSRNSRTGSRGVPGGDTIA